MQIQLDSKLSNPQIAALLEQHLADMYATSPPESVHSLDLEQLRAPQISFWTLWDAQELAGCGALKALNSRHGEIKSMRTASHYRRQGVASMLLDHIIQVARLRGYSQLSLETGSMEFFSPARQLYVNKGFTYCGPFQGYQEDPNSTFMTLNLD